MPTDLVTVGALFPRDTPWSAAGVVAIPIRTRLVRPGDDVTDLVAQAVAGIARPDDVVVIAETAVAIAQGRAIAAETIRPSRLAYVLSRRAGALATVNQPESLQLVIDEVGAPRVLYAACMHVLGRLRGRRGVFYEILGETIATIDGYTGTLPPFERTIVLGPQHPDRVAQLIAERIGAHAVVVDANDLGIAKVLGASRGVRRAAVEEALVHNPQGNGDEQTPVVLLKRRGTGAHPFLEGAA
ncbi:MAG TPA: coenzyme F420-0:L-glutamate ligase [Candidatus Baltobacteraceae bacterium]